MYCALAPSLDTIIHNGALVNHAFSYEQLFEPNVLGSLEVTSPCKFGTSMAGIRRWEPDGQLQAPLPHSLWHCYVCFWALPWEARLSALCKRMMRLPHFKKSVCRS